MKFIILWKYARVLELKVTFMMKEAERLIQKYNIKVRKSNRAKKIALRFTGNTIELVLPIRISLKTAYDFLLSQTKWIEEKLKNYTSFQSEVNPNTCIIFGKHYDIVKVECSIMKYAKIESNRVKVFGTKEDFNNSLKQLLIKIITDKINYLCSFYAKKHNFSYRKIFIKEMKTKWGSCSSLKNLNFNWRVVFAPIQVIEYLVVHELCHLKEMNHGKRYWQLVETIYPNYKEQKQWLKNNSYKLYSYA